LKVISLLVSEWVAVWESDGDEPLMNEIMAGRTQEEKVVGCMLPVVVALPR
jgi:hypothetical protein